MHEDKSPIWYVDPEKDGCKKLEKKRSEFPIISTFYYPRAGGLFNIDSEIHSISFKSFEGEVKKRMICYEIAKNNLSHKVFNEKDIEWKLKNQKDITTIDDDFIKKIDKKIEEGFKVPEDEERSKMLLKFFSENSESGDAFVFQKNLASKPIEYLPTMKPLKEIIIDPRQLSAYCYARRKEDDFNENIEFQQFLQELFEEKLIEICSKNNFDESIGLNIKAIRVSKKGRNSSQKNFDSKSAFVGMWFHPDMSFLFDDVFNPVIGSLGFKAILIKQEIHGERIDSKIETEIKKSRFVIMDLTAEFNKKTNKYVPRGSVYFEAGFAKGKEVPVIWTCREDILNSNQLPFDVSHYKILDWRDNNLDQFKKDLEKEIKGRLKLS